MHISCCKTNRRHPYGICCTSQLNRKTHSTIFHLKIFRLFILKFEYNNMRIEMAISFKKEGVNKRNTSKVFVFLFFIIGLCAFSLYLSTITVNAQLSSNSTSSSNSTTNETRVTRMGICVVGAGGPCN